MELELHEASSLPMQLGDEDAMIHVRGQCVIFAACLSCDLKSVGNNNNDDDDDDGENGDDDRDADDEQ